MQWPREEGQTIQSPREEGQTIQSPREEEQTTQWPREKRQKDKQRSTKHAHKTKDRATRTPSKPGRTQVIRKGKQFLLQM